MPPTVQQKSPTLGTLYRGALLTKNVLLAGSRIDTDTLWTVHLMLCKRCFVQNADILTLNNCTVQSILCLQFILVMFYSMPFSRHINVMHIENDNVQSLHLIDSELLQNARKILSMPQIQRQKRNNNVTFTSLMRCYKTMHVLTFSNYYSDYCGKHS